MRFRCPPPRSAGPALTVLLCALATPVAAKEGWTWEAAYTADVIGTVAGERRAGRFLDNLDLIAERKFGGLTAHAHLLSNSGGAPNDVAGTLQGIDNIEVARPRAKVYELWVEHALPDPRFSLRAGLYDLNSEFYATEAAGLLIAPPFGIGSELASTGPNGPSIFPSTAVAVRARFMSEDGVYAQAAALNAQAGAPGDPGGTDLGFDAGALLIAEAGVRGDLGGFGVGAWRYTERQDDLRDLSPSGAPAGRTAQGAYVLGERRLFGQDDGRAVTGFVRAGVSDGDTTPFAGGWQAGLLVSRPFAGRPDSAISIGVHQGILTDKHRANGADSGLDLGPAESGLELTYADALAPGVTLQPTLQYVRRPAGDRHTRDAVVLGVRFIVDWASAER